MTAHAVEGDGPLLDGPLLDDSASAGGAFIGAEFVGAEVGSPGVAAAIDALGLAGLLAARSEARRLVEDDGITYGVGARARTWTIDPLPLVIGTDEWARLEAGLRQRALVLDLVLTDLYGERRLLRERLLPPELVLGHPGFLPQVDGIRLPGDRQLIQVATDLVRDDTGAWTAVADRTQVPSGSGYAMANRRITSRVMAGLHRRTPLARLRGFFDTMRTTLLSIAPEDLDLPRVALLSPGAESETAFEIAFLSTLLGFPVVESEDLTTRGGRIHIRSADKTEPIDVLLRRVDAAYSDPLDLRPDSRLGATGLIEASRRGRISVANPLGAGVLESPALLAHLPQLTRQLLGEDALLPSAPTWWGGEPQGQAYLLNNLDRLVLKGFSREIRPEATFGWELSAAAKADLAAAIAARPWEWTGQEPMPGSTAPVVTAAGLQPRRVVLRTFAVAHDSSYVILPGGLARVAARPDQHLIANATGALTKDVWVLAPAGTGVERITLDQRPQATPLRLAPAVAPRVADNLFWVGRYAERADGLARLLRVGDDLVEDFGARPGTPGHATMQAVITALAALTRTPSIEADPVVGLRGLTLDADRTGTLAYAVTRLIGATYQVRDQLSQDIWIVLGRLERALREIPRDEAQLQPQLARILESLLAIAGILAESMVRDATWGFLDGGIRLERAMNTAALLRHTVIAQRAPVVDGQVAESALLASESILTHRRRTVAGLGPAAPVSSALTLLLTDETNPRSVAYQLRRLADAMDLVGDPTAAATARALLADVTRVDAEGAASGDRTEFATFLDTLDLALRDLGAHIERVHFARKATQHSLPIGWSLTTEGAGRGAE